ncbi:MAG: sigma-70 family RNA polymerase sigma factor [Rhodothermales bacterium]|nr:sigma-70 family RNA polymerase sigma factor [Rhodothermales bacterium]
MGGDALDLTVRRVSSDPVDLDWLRQSQEVHCAETLDRSIPLENADSNDNVTRLLSQVTAGDAKALNRLMPLVYEELKQVAHRQLRRERPDHTLNTTALVNEAYIKLSNQHAPWQNRAHFYAIAAQSMRRILVHYAEKRNAEKRGGGAVPHSIERDLLEVGDGLDPSHLDLVLSIDDALKKLEQFNERGARVVEYKFFGGLTYEEIAEVLGVSNVTVRRSWSTAQAWLRKEIADR